MWKRVVDLAIRRIWMWGGGASDEKERERCVMEKIRRYYVEAQREVHGSTSCTCEELIDWGVVEDEERDACLDGLAILCKNGELEMLDGRYYVKGRAPIWP